MTTEFDDIFTETLEHLSWHIWPKYGDRIPFDAFKRLLAKNIRAEGWTPHDHADISPEQIMSYREKRTTAELAAFSRGHDRAQPKSLEGPIIIAVVDGVERLLDGNNRINYWESIGDNSKHDVHVHLIAARDKPVP